MKIRDLPAPITASKADWLAGTTWLGFTPTGTGPGARSQCQTTINRQFGSGYVIEYITEQFSEPNPGFENDPKYLEEREKHNEIAGCLIAVHRLKTTARGLWEILGDDEYEKLQDMWAQEGKRVRWSVAFPIIESYEIVGRPKAKSAFSSAQYRNLYQRSSAGLRKLDDSHRAALQNLEIEYKPAGNAWIGIEDELDIAEKDTIPESIQALINEDLQDNALEGYTLKRKIGIKRRAARMAYKFAMKRQEEGTLYCDLCRFDPTKDPMLTGIKPRSMLDVHHKNPLAEGVRYTNDADLALLCPTCHRAEHMSPTPRLTRTS
jgi:5-methylcytosine-specific restriction protein A